MPRARKPSAIRELEGDRGHRPESKKNRSEPKPEIVALDPPADLPPDALKAWNYMTEKLLALRVMSEIDGPLMEGFVRTYALWRTVTAAAERANVGGNVDGKLTRLSLQLLTAMRTVGREFGLTPAGRAAIETLPEKGAGEDELEALMD